MTRPAVLEPGDEIRCGRCEQVILVCVREVGEGSQIKSRDFTLPDGAPLERHARMQCQFCNSDFMTIMTKQKVTVPKGRGL